MHGLWVIHWFYWLEVCVKVFLFRWWTWWTTPCCWAIKSPKQCRDGGWQLVLAHPLAPSCELQTQSVRVQPSIKPKIRLRHQHAKKSQCSVLHAFTHARVCVLLCVYVYASLSPFVYACAYMYVYMYLDVYLTKYTKCIRWHFVLRTVLRRFGWSPSSSGAGVLTWNRSERLGLGTNFMAM